MKYANKNQKWLSGFVSIFGICAASFIQTDAAAHASEAAPASMPVKEITIFKDGHAFVLHEGKMPTGTDGNVAIDYLPRPIIGTFWAYSADTKAKLTGVVSHKRVVPIKRTALTIPELIEGNIGAKVRITEAGLAAYETTILGIPTRSTEELSSADPPGSPEKLPQRGSIVLLKFEGGVKAVPISRIQEVTFLDEPRLQLAGEQFRDMMTLKLDWDRRKPERDVNVGMVYVQRGIRWIPNYRIDIDGKGNAIVKLQATIINELTDVEDISAHLVIGVPKFAFENTPDPISLQQTVAQLSRHFRPDSQAAYAFSNMIMSQAVRPVRRAEVPAANDGNALDLGPDIAGSGKNEDLYVFTLEHVTLKKGQRMVVPVAEYELKYRDVFVLDLPFGPPPEVRHNLNSQQQTKLAQLYHSPKVMHKIRLANNAKCPLTTAPALILRQGRIIAQGMMTYTAVGASSDLELTAAVDIAVDKLDKETDRIPDAAKWDNYTYARSNLTGTIHLTNHRSDTVNLEIRRSVLGHVDSASHEGSIEHLGRHEGGWMDPNSRPFWWGWYNWPYWWYHFNAVGRVTWECELKPGKTVELEYKWHYFWRR
ncbi:MAG: hypothetical protein CEE38_02985 [Planctomycetes bacterium B3_Pla]|nr:MAG: hypothetical protein CEE38_02985 [Planctomycetes bacterium B3_Pla]